MKSSLLSTHPRLRRILPWALWGLAAAIGIPMAVKQAGIGSSPAVIEAKVASLSPMRTDHRLRVAKIFVTPGQAVKAGDLLVQMDTTEIDDDLAIAHAKLVYEEIMAGLRQVSLLDARVRTSHELAATAERAALDVARVIAEAERDRSELKQLDENLALEEKLVADKLASADRLKAMRLQRAALAKKVDEYRLAVTQARKSASGSNQRLGQWAKGSKNAKPVALPLPEAPMGDARAAAGELHRREIVRLEFLKKGCDLRAPFAGRVGEILVTVGGLSSDPGVPVVTVVEEESKMAIAYLAQASSTKIRVGDTVRLVPRDLSGPPLTGRVTALAPNITEIPVRFRRVPNLQEFVRNAYIQLDAPVNLPGLAFDAVFRHGPGSGT
jgi:membrane fusion protein, multidrug efflux system